MLTEQQHIDQARQCFGHLQKYTNYRDIPALLNLLRAHLKNAGSSVDVLDPEGKRDVLDIQEELAGIERQYHLGVARELYDRLQEGDPSFRATREKELDRSILLANARYSDLDPSGKKTEEEVFQVIKDSLRKAQLKDAKNELGKIILHPRMAQAFFVTLNSTSEKLSKIKADFEEMPLTATFMAQIDGKLQAQERVLWEDPIYSKNIGVALYKRFMDSLPIMPCRDNGFTEALFTPNAKGFAPLDNPRLWQNPENALLLLRETELKPENLLRSTQREGSLLGQALISLSPETVVQEINRRNIVLGADMLLEEGQPSCLLKTLLRTEGGVKALFISSNLSPNLLDVARRVPQVAEAMSIQNQFAMRQMACGSAARSR